MYSTVGECVYQSIEIRREREREREDGNTKQQVTPTIHQNNDQIHKSYFDMGDIILRKMYIQW